MVTDNPKTQKRIMGKNNSEVSLSDVDYDQISLSRLEDQKYDLLYLTKHTVISMEIGIHEIIFHKFFCLNIILT